MKLTHVTFSGPPVDDPELLGRLPRNLAELLGQVNGFIQFHGGLHVRGACREPAWHSLRDAWLGEQAFHLLYPDVQPGDIPFAEDCLGDQFLLRSGLVWRLSAETGELEPLNLLPGAFLAAAQEDPVEFLGLEPLLQFQRDGGTLQPGQQLMAYPPFCTRESANGVVLKAVPADEHRRFLASFAAHIRNLPEGEQINIRVED